MTNPASDTSFTGSIPELYEQLLVPLIFEPYAVDLARRAQALRPSQVLEVAAGTGVATRHLATSLPTGCTLVATDLNGAMLEVARHRGASRPVDWQVADAMQLPFEDGAFDLVVCQFGVMFFPDKPHAFSEARRVLRPGGHLLFNVWDRLEANAFPQVVQAALARLFPDDPSWFMERVPHGYHDIGRIRQDLAAGGFEATADVETVTHMSHAASAQLVAQAFCQATPMRNEIERRAPDGLKRATEAGRQALQARFGAGPVEGPIQAHVVTVRR